MNPTEHDPNNPSDAAHPGVEGLARIRGASRGERWFRSLVQNSSDVVMILEADATVRYVSPAVERVLGYRPEEMVETLALDYVHPEDLEYMSRSFVQTLEKPGVQPPVEYRVRAADGSWRYMEAVRSNWLGDPHIEGVVANVRDITERKKAEVALKESEERYRAVVEQSMEGMYLGATDTKRILQSNAAFQKMLGYTAEELCGMHIYDFVVHDQENIDSVFRSTLNRGHHFIGERKYRRKDGSIVDVETSATVISYDGREVMCTVARNITERKKTEEALKESEERYRAVVEQSAESIWLFDPDTKQVLESNTAFEQMLGYTAEELREMANYDFVAHSREDVDSAVERVVQERRGFFGERKYRCKDGTVLDVEVSGTVIPYKGREVVCGVARDLTERKRTEEALRRSESSLAAAQRIAHLGNWEYDVGKDEACWSDEMYRIFGFAPGDLVPSYRAFMLFVHPDDRERVRGSIRGALRGGGPEDIEYRLVRPDSEVRFVHTQYEAVYDGAGRPTKFFGTVQDVTDSKQVEQKLREAEQKYRLLVEQIPAVAYIDRADVPDAVSYTSPRIEALLGYTPEEWLSGRLWLERLHPDDRDWVLETDTRARTAEEPFSEEYRLIARDGRVVWVRDESALLRDDEGRPLLWQGILLDITERKQAEEALRESEERYRRLVESSPEAIAVHDGQRVLYANPAAARLFGAEAPSELIGREVFGFVHPDDRGTVASRVRAVLEGGEGAPLLEERYLRLDGGVVDAEVAGEPITYAGKPAVQVVLRDVSGRKRMEEELRHRATHDPLTGLPNRRLFVDRLGQALVRTRRRPKHKVGVLFMDLDGFKVVNDSLGHDAGDRLLAAVAERLKGCLRPEDTLARFAGDEFIVLLEEIEGADDALRVTQRIAEELRGPFALDGRELILRLSIGVALGEARTKSPEELLRDADTAMYRAKDEAADYRVFDPVMHEQALGRMELENDLRHALEKEEFTIYYQPKFRLGQQDRIEGIEALVRWKHPQRGFMLPDEFIPIAEETGLIIPIGDWVMKEACRQAKGWQERYPSEPPLAVCVNLSAAQVRYPGLLKDVRSALGESGLGAGSLILEITEGTLLKDTQVIETTFRRLKDLGVKLAIDDFGKEYSSLSYLNRLPVDSLKIDRLFLESFGENPGNLLIVEAVISLAHSIGLEVTGEGVESAEQLGLLRGMGCDLAQGYHLARPLPREEVEQLLAGLFTGVQQDRRDSGE